VVRVASRGRRRGPSSRRCQLDRDRDRQPESRHVGSIPRHLLHLPCHSFSARKPECRHLVSSPPFPPTAGTQFAWRDRVARSLGGRWGLDARLDHGTCCRSCDARGGRRRCASSDDGAGHAVGGAISGRGSSRRSGRVSVTTATDWHGGGDAGGRAGAIGSPSPRSDTRASWGRRRGVKVVARRENKVTVPDAGLSQTESGDFMS